MSTIKVSNVQNPSAASAAITLDANGQATLNGLAYPTSGSLSGRNRVINGSMTVDQRNAGASVTINATAKTYIVDRWHANGQSSDGVFTVQRSTTAPDGFTNSLLATVTTADSSIGADQYYLLCQRIEGYNVADLGFGTASAKSFTLSFWVRSSLTGTFSGSFENGAENRAYPFTYSISTANTWEQKTITVSGDTSGTWLTDNGIGIFVWFDLGCGSNKRGTAGSWTGSNLYGATGATSLIATNGATFYITGVQLEAGSVATPFERRSYGQELALCQRYYYRISGSDTSSSNVGVYGVGFSQSTTAGRAVVEFPVTMRTFPTALEQSGTASHYRIIAGSTGNISCSAVPTFTTSSVKSIDLSWTVASGATANQGVLLMSNNASSYIGVSAEL